MVCCGKLLEEVGVCVTSLDVTRLAYAHDDAALQSFQGLPVVLTCLKGFKGGSRVVHQAPRF